MAKWTTQKIHKAIKLGEKELAQYKVGSSQWYLIYTQIEIIREDLLK